jgi:DMSO/TMAO reductase YedYZ molybdopterin-dependent catalytic subunit
MAPGVVAGGHPPAGHAVAAHRSERMSDKLAELNTPIFWAEGHPGPLSREGWEVELVGLVRKPLTLTYADIVALPKSVVHARLTSVSGWTVGGRWGGVRLSHLFSRVEPAPEAAHVQFTSYRGVYTTSIPLDVAMRERTLLAYEFDGQPLTPDYGGPVRIFCPYLWGYKSAKSVVSIRLQERSVRGYWEVRGYPDAAQIRARRVLDVNSGQWRHIPDGEVTEFLD